MKLLKSIILLVVLVMGSGSVFAQQQNPEAFAGSFYQKYLELNIRGLPDERQLKALSPFLSEDLQRLFVKARAEQQQFIKKNPEEKPPWIEGDLFTSLFEGARSFKVGKAKKRGNYVDVSVGFEYQEGGSTSRWNDELVLVRTKNGWRVHDVLLKGDWQFKGGSSLRQSLKAR
jgi:hypothetical protein